MPSTVHALVAGVSLALPSRVTHLAQEYVLSTCCAGKVYMRITPLAGRSRRASAAGLVVFEDSGVQRIASLGGSSLLPFLWLRSRRPCDTHQSKCGSPYHNKQDICLSSTSEVQGHLSMFFPFLTIVVYCCCRQMASAAISSVQGLHSTASPAVARSSGAAKVCTRRQAFLMMQTKV